MAFGYSPVAPITYDQQDGFKLNKTFEQVSMQNLKMLVLTSPGERIMYPKFGVGVTRSLFENDSQPLRDNIGEKIREQAATYMPYIRIEGVLFSDIDNPQKEHELSMRIDFSISSNRFNKTLSINIDI
jgi:phage baseplate assembly protein W